MNPDRRIPLPPASLLNFLRQKRKRGSMMDKPGEPCVQVYPQLPDTLLTPSRAAYNHHSPVVFSMVRVASEVARPAMSLTFCEIFGNFSYL